MRTRLWPLPHLVLAATLLAPRAQANSSCERGEPGTERERAKEQYRAGLSAFDAKRYSEAIDHLTCANQLLPNPAFAYNIAITYEAMGDVPTALRWYREHRRQAGEDAAEAVALAKVTQLEAALQARGIQQVTLFSNPPGATLSVDDRPLGLTPFTLELNPGRHRYRLTLAGHDTVEGFFELRVDRSLDVEAELSVTQQSPAIAVSAPSDHAAAPPAQHAGEPGQSGARVGAWTWISLGAGAALLGTALGFEWRRAELDEELGRASQAEYPDRHDAMTAHQTTARVLAGLGAGALIGGGVLLTLDLARDESTANVALGTCTGGVCVEAAGAF